MRCALNFDENKDLADQNVAAWGELQSLDEEPAYKEEDIKDARQKDFFEGCKEMVDDVCIALPDMLEDGNITEDGVEHLERVMSGSLALWLFSILDHQEEEKEKEKEKENGTQAGE